MSNWLTLDCQKGSVWMLNVYYIASINVFTNRRRLFSSRCGDSASSQRRIVSIVSMRLVNHTSILAETPSITERFDCFATGLSCLSTE